MSITGLLLSIGGSVMNAAGGVAEHAARPGPSWSIHLPDAITYALFGGGLIAIAVVRRRRT